MNETVTFRRPADGALIEYRRNPYDPGILNLEARGLKPDGTPYADEWFPITDETFAFLQRTEAGRDLIDRLWQSPDHP